VCPPGEAAGSILSHGQVQGKAALVTGAVASASGEASKRTLAYRSVVA
jgi:hypothetical protein